jgi:hypothetical protein
MKTMRLMDRPEDFVAQGIDPEKVALWEDGRRSDGGKMHSEVWYFDAMFDDGSRLVVGFRPKRPTKMSSDGDYPDFNIAITTPEGVTKQEFVNFDATECSFSKDTCDHHFGPNYVVGDFDHYDIHIQDANGLGCDVHYQAEVEPFRQGTGMIELDGDPEKYYTDLPVVKSKVTGTLTYDGRTVEVTGLGYHDYQWNTVSPLMTFHHWLWGRLYTENYTVYIYDFVGTKKYGYRRVPFFGIQDNATGETLFRTNGNIDVKTELYLQPTLQERFPKKSAYVFDNGDGNCCNLHIACKQEIECRPIDAVFTKKQRMAFKLAGVHPTYMRYVADAEFTLNLADGREISEVGEMMYEYNYMGKEEPGAGV